MPAFKTNQSLKLSLEFPLPIEDTKMAPNLKYFEQHLEQWAARTSADSLLSPETKALLDAHNIVRRLRQENSNILPHFAWVKLDDAERYLDCLLAERLGIMRLSRGGKMLVGSEITAYHKANQTSSHHCPRCGGEFQSWESSCPCKEAE